MKPTIKPINISFRAFEIQDIEDVLAIERLAYKIPWNKAKFTHRLIPAQNQRRDYGNETRKYSNHCRFFLRSLVKHQGAQEIQSDTKPQKSILSKIISQVKI
jgi:hypothetical protein